MAQNRCFNSSKDFKPEEFIAPVLYTFKDLSTKSGTVFYREDYLDHLLDYIQLTGTAATRRHRETHTYLWQHFADLALSMIKDAGVFESYDYRKGMYKALSDDAVSFINGHTEDELTRIIKDNFQKNVNLVEAWTKTRPKKIKLIKKAKATV